MEDIYNFESFLGELSAKLVNLPLDSIDEMIEYNMKRLVEFFDADRCHIGELSNDQDKIVGSYFYSRPDIKIPQINEMAEHFLSFIYKSIKEGETLAFADTSEMPDHSKNDHDIIEALGIKSVLVIPLKIQDEVRFGLSLSTVGRNHQWDQQSIHQIKIIGNILANIIQKKLYLMAKELKETHNILYVVNEVGIFSYVNKPFDSDQMEQVMINAEHSCQAEKKLKENKEKFRGVFNSMTDVVTRSDLEGSIEINSVINKGTNINLHANKLVQL